MAGEGAVQHLHWRAGLISREAAASVRTLASISGDAALATLESYAGDTRVAVARELIRAWRRFPTAAYVERVLAHSPLDRGAVHLTSVDEVPYLTQLQNLKSASLKVPPGRADMNVIVAQPKITELILQQESGLRDLAPLSRLPELRALSVGWAGLENLEGLSKCLALRSLELRQCNELRTLEGLEPVKLEQLALISCRTLGDLAGVSAGNLKRVRIKGCPIDSLAALREAHSLRRLEIESLQLTTLSGLENLALEQLSVLWTEVLDLSALASLEVLKRLDLTLATAVVLPPIPSSLGSLALIGARFLSDLRGLENVLGLRSLRVYGAEALTDLAAVADLESLELLSLGFCTQLQDLSPLRKLRRLKTLEIWAAPRVDLSSLNSLAGVVFRHSGVDLGALDVAAFQRNNTLQTLS